MEKSPNEQTPSGQICAPLQEPGPTLSIKWRGGEGLGIHQHNLPIVSKVPSCCVKCLLLLNKSENWEEILFDHNLHVNGKVVRARETVGRQIPCTVSVFLDGIFFSALLYTLPSPLSRPSSRGLQENGHSLAVKMVNFKGIFWLLERPSPLRRERPAFTWPDQFPIQGPSQAGCWELPIKSSAGRVGRRD